MRKTKGVKMSDLREFEELEKDICAFAEEMQSKGHKVHYEGPFITGKLENPKILFLSINPGGGDETVTKNELKKIKNEEKSLKQEKAQTRQQTKDIGKER